MLTDYGNMEHMKNAIWFYDVFQIFLDFFRIYRIFLDFFRIFLYLKIS